MGVPKLATAAIFVLAGLGLKRGEAESALQAWPAVLYGITAILVLTPAAAFGCTALAASLPLQRDLLLGLAVFCCMPTTLASGVALTVLVNANAAVALLLTLATNVLGVFTMPLVLQAVLAGCSPGMPPIDASDLMLRLVQSILLPLGVGVSIRASLAGVRTWVDAHKPVMSNAQSVMLGLVPWTQVAAASANKVALGVDQLLAVAALAAAIHVVYLGLNTVAVHLFRLGDVKVKRAVVLVASQKTLPVCVAVLLQLPSLAGVAVVSCVVAHLAQILIDSALVQHWLSGGAAAGVAHQ